MLSAPQQIFHCCAKYVWFLSSSCKLVEKFTYSSSLLTIFYNLYYYSLYFTANTRAFDIKKKKKKKKKHTHSKEIQFSATNIDTFQVDFKSFYSELVRIFWSTYPGRPSGCGVLHKCGYSELVVLVWTPKICLISFCVSLVLCVQIC